MGHSSVQLLKMKSSVLLFLCGVVGLVAGKCTDIYEMGISEEGKEIVLDMHNKYRRYIAQGMVFRQPRGVDMLRMSYDKKLEKGSMDVSTTCIVEHLKTPDQRFEDVGQNIFAIWTSDKNCTQDWPMAVNGWWNEHTYFGFPDKNLGTGPIGHYTQLVWARSFLIGCDFICYEDLNKPGLPYARMYTCNYGPGGNLVGAKPYTVGESGCEDLCDPETLRDTVEEYDYD